jgi:UTP--glucose-1-phosphate uridylyltransferase
MPVQAISMQGMTLDCGSKLGYLLANIKFGMAHPETGDALKAWLKAQDF